MSKILYVLRGLPGSGKSTIGNLIANEVWEADKYFNVFCQGVFKPERLGRAHEWCREQVEEAMQEEVSTIAVANTNTQEWEMKPYFDLAEEYGYTVFSIIVENRHGNKSIHNVPEKTIEKMCNRFEVEL